ncbi:hypothetical protein [Streptomyces antibioticus]|uniref:hypothetical protein n=1 Tax=Streptomyces antibioticus TaxID=1890 RepID=UPI0036DB0535
MRRKGKSAGLTKRMAFVGSAMAAVTAFACLSPGTASADDPEVPPFLGGNGRYGANLVHEVYRVADATYPPSEAPRVSMGHENARFPPAAPSDPFFVDSLLAMVPYPRDVDGDPNLNYFQIYAHGDTQAYTNQVFRAYSAMLESHDARTGWECTPIRVTTDPVPGGPKLPLGHYRPEHRSLYQEAHIYRLQRWFPGWDDSQYLTSKEYRCER